MNRLRRSSNRGLRFFMAALWVQFLLLMLAGGVHGMEASSERGFLREVRVGMAAHDVDGLWSGEKKEKGADLCLAVLFNHRLFTLLSADAYPNIGVSLNTRGDTSKVYGGFLLQWEFGHDWFAATGFGLALHDGERRAADDDRKSLGSQVLFRTPIEIGFSIDRHHRVILAFDHISNAGLTTPNEGLDTLGLFYSYRF